MSERQIWNEGRVVGYSAYEMYVKQHLAAVGNNPDIPPVTQRQWIEDNISKGRALLFRVPNRPSVAEGEVWKADIPLPENSLLSAGSTILAQFFDGEGEFSEYTPQHPYQHLWATKVISYGRLISNTSSLSPATGTSTTSNIAATSSPSTVPPAASMDLDDETKNRLLDYCKVFDGVIIQPGKWKASAGSSDPAKDLEPNLTIKSNVDRPVLRISGRGPVTTYPRILLTGFTIRTELASTSNTDGSTSPQHPENGDFLGPAVYPWANKVIFCMPNASITYLMPYLLNGGYKRKVPTGGSATSVNDRAIVDMRTTDPKTFYPANIASRPSGTPKFSREVSTTHTDYLAVTELNKIGQSATDGAAVLTVYQPDTKYPPVLYGTLVTGIDSGSNNNNLFPLDIAAPGAVKMLYNDNPNQAQAQTVVQAQAVAYEQAMPECNALVRTPDGRLQVLNSNGDLVYIANVAVLDFLSNGTAAGLSMNVRTGNTIRKAIALSDTSGNDLAINGSGGEMTLADPDNHITDTGDGAVVDYGNLYWRNLLNALKNNKYFNFANVLKNLKQGAGIEIKQQDGTNNFVISAVNDSTSGTSTVRAFDVYGHSAKLLQHYKTSNLYELADKTKAYQPESSLPNYNNLVLQSQYSDMFNGSTFDGSFNSTRFGCYEYKTYGQVFEHSDAYHTFVSFWYDTLGGGHASEYVTFDNGQYGYSTGGVQPESIHVPHVVVNKSRETVKKTVYFDDGTGFGPHDYNIPITITITIRMGMTLSVFHAGQIDPSLDGAMSTRYERIYDSNIPDDDPTYRYNSQPDPFKFQHSTPMATDNGKRCWIVGINPVSSKSVYCPMWYLDPVNTLDENGLPKQLFDFTDTTESNIWDAMTYVKTTGSSSDPVAKRMPVSWSVGHHLMYRPAHDYVHTPSYPPGQVPQDAFAPLLIGYASNIADGFNAYYRTQAKYYNEQLSNQYIDHTALTFATTVFKGTFILR